MLYYDNEWKICPFIAHYKSYGKPEFKYTHDKQWWIEFVNRWWHHTDLSFTNVNPTEAQQTRLDEVNAAGIPEGFGYEASMYVESGLVLNSDNPHFAGFTEQPNFTNSYSMLRYEGVIEELLETTAKKKGYKSADRLFNYTSSSNVQWKAEADTFTQWRDDMFEYCYQMLNQVATGQRPAPTVDELLAELPDIVWPKND